MSKTRYKRVYISDGSYYFVDLARKWHKLCRVSDGEAAMLRALAKRKDTVDAAPGTISALIKDFQANVLIPSRYAGSTIYDYGLMLPKIQMAFEAYTVADLNAGIIDDLVEQWADKPRTANKYKLLVSLLMRRAIKLKLRHDNPCRDVESHAVKKRMRYITDAELLAIRDGVLTGNDGRRNASGPMILAAVDLAYLTAVRMTDIRLLEWSDVHPGHVAFRPHKTRSTTGARLEVPRTPDIDAVLESARTFGKVKGTTVIHNLVGDAYTKDGIETAWSRACRRAQVDDAHFHDLRAKALSDAKRRGLSMEKLKDAATHASVGTTEGYMRGFETQVSELNLTLPKRKVGP